MFDKQWRRALGLWAAAVSVVFTLLAGCGAPAAKAPNPTRPLDQQRALQLIAQAVSAEGETPTGARPIALPREQRLIADVGVSGRKFAIAFITREERQSLGPSVPAHDVGSNALQLVRDATDRQARVLILHDLNYMTDEQAGEERDVSSVVVERRLQRDVRDFVVEARRQRWP